MTYLIISSKSSNNKKTVFYMSSITDYIYIKRSPPVLPTVVGISKLNIVRDFNDCVKNWFKIVKHDILNSKMRQLVPRFSHNLLWLLCMGLLHSISVLNFIDL